MALSEARNGNFTSSSIAELMTKTDINNILAGKPVKDELSKDARTYIQKKNYERRLNRALVKEVNSRPVVWGQACEPRIFNIVDTSYQDTHKKTLTHPEFTFWKGTPDAIRHTDNKAVADFKCPFTMDSFCKLVDKLYDGLSGWEVMLWLIENHQSGQDYFWQLVSNAILTGCDYTELIVYAPFKSEIQEIQDSVMMMDDAKQYRFKWIAYADVDELPWIPDTGSIYNNVNKIEFAIPQEFKDALTSRVQLAGEYLINKPIAA